jgi:hypothetical protein
VVGSGGSTKEGRGEVNGGERSGFLNLTGLGNLSDDSPYALDNCQARLKIGVRNGFRAVGVRNLFRAIAVGVRNLFRAIAVGVRNGFRAVGVRNLFRTMTKNGINSGLQLRARLTLCVR